MNSLDARIRNLGKLLAKLLLSGAALYLVFQQIDTHQLLAHLTSANPLWLISAVVAYNASKVLSSFRLTRYLRANDIHLSEWKNLRLYYTGMFYNLFLVGGIGGDAYKIWVLRKDPGATVKKSFQSLFFDRLNGMMSLAILGFLFGWLAFPEAPWRNLMLAGAAASLPALYVIHRFLAPPFLSVWQPTTALSLGVQVFQLLCAWLLLTSMGIMDHTEAYLAVFLLSSLVSILPISIGGIGIRELVFLTAAGFSGISKDASVAFSLMFFVVTAISSLPGGFLTPLNKK
ncbi:MAG: flippase-like domain-containing protein [Cyclobacteriaceae bacterium]|nr:flippase-like domain-containing protein [Cyclobacteriaceae bacterium]